VLDAIGSGAMRRNGDARLCYILSSRVEEHRAARMPALVEGKHETTGIARGHRPPLAAYCV
jgi:hypothetical protein